jgi:hypothetical protein
MNKNGKSSGLITFGVIAVVAILALLVWSVVFKSPVGQTAYTTGGETAPSAQLEGVKCAAAPTITYQTQDKYGTTVVGGTGYYKVDNSAYSTTAYSPGTLGANVKYWVQNATAYYVTPTTFAVDECNKQIIPKTGIANGTATLTAYDNVASASVSNGVVNVTLAANGQASITYKYQPTAKQGFMPFGGVLVLEQNSTIPTSGITCSAPFLTSNMGADAFTVTYIPTSSATHSFKIYKVLSSIEDGAGTLKEFTCQYVNGASSPGFGAFRATLYPANYYPTNDGNILLDVEQAANGLTTRTGMGGLTRTGTWNN